MAALDTVALCARARELASAFEDGAAAAEETARQAHVAAVAAAQDRLLRHLLDGVGEGVLEAAGRGKRELDLVAFEGGDTFEGEFTYLYLLRGPRQREPGVEPLLPRLRACLAPFRVRHVWKPGTVQNAVVVSWAQA